MVIGGTIGLTYFFAILMARTGTTNSLFLIIATQVVCWIIALIAILVSNSNYKNELQEAKAEAEITAVNDVFLSEHGLSSMENWDLFHDETAQHFKRISDMPNGVLYSLVGKIGARARLVHDNGKFISFHVLDQNSSKQLGGSNARQNAVAEEGEN